MNKHIFKLIIDERIQVAIALVGAGLFATTLTAVLEHIARRKIDAT